MFLKLPIIGPCCRRSRSRASRARSARCSRRGVPILDALEIVAKTAGNVVIEEALMRVRAAISEGKTMAEPLAESDVFPGMVVQMIARR